MMQGLRIAAGLVVLIVPGCDLAPTEDPLQSHMNLRATEWHACVMREYRIAKGASGNQSESANLAFRKCKAQEAAFNTASRVAAGSR
jgi:hypothetical protein